MIGWIKRTAFWVSAIAVIIFTTWLSGKNSQRKQDEVKDLKSYAKTRKEIDNAEDNISDDPSVLRDWLRERGKQ
jgi:uncharacterized membrane protein affecting hemolysin expression